MKTKREVLELFARWGYCKGIDCSECPYNSEDCCVVGVDLSNNRLAKIGAMAILRQNRKKGEFDINKILTCVTADKAKVGMRGYFADNLADLKSRFKNNEVYELEQVLDISYGYRFQIDNGFAIDGIHYALFYPIDEVEE